MATIESSNQTLSKELAFRMTATNTSTPSKYDEIQIIHEKLTTIHDLHEVHRNEYKVNIEAQNIKTAQIKSELDNLHKTIDALKNSSLEFKLDYLGRLIKGERHLKFLENKFNDCFVFMRQLLPPLMSLKNRIDKFSFESVSNAVVSNTTNNDNNQESNEVSLKWTVTDMNGDKSAENNNLKKIKRSKANVSQLCNICNLSFKTFAKLYRHKVIKHHQKNKKPLIKRLSLRNVVKLRKGILNGKAFLIPIKI